MTDIRMPDGTVIRGVPDGVSKDDLNTHLIEKYGQEKFNLMTGSTKAALSADAPEQPAQPAKEPTEFKQPSARPTSGASQYLHEIRAREGREPNKEEMDTAVRMRRSVAGEPEFPAEPNKFNQPYQAGMTGQVSEFGEDVVAGRTEETPAIPLTGDKSKETAARMRTVEANPSIPDEFIEGDRLTALGIESPDTMGGRGGTEKESRQEKIEKQGRLIEVMVDKGIKTPEDYGIPTAAYKDIMRDRTQEEMKRRKEAAEGAEAAGEIAEPTAGQEVERSRWLAFKKQVGGLIEGFDRLFETGDADDKYRAKQYESLGAMWLDAVARTDPESSDLALGIIVDKAEEMGIPPEMYQRTLAMQLDHLAEDTNATIDGVQEFQRQLIENLPETEWEDNKIGYIANKLIENTNSAAYMAAGLATRSPAVLAVLMGSDVYGRSYTSARANGRSEGEAVADASFSAFIELATEGIPLARVLKAAKLGNKSRAAKFLQGMGNEGTQELMVEALQIGYDMGVIGEDISIGEAWVQLRDAGIVGAVFGGGMSAPSTIVGDNQMRNLTGDVQDAKKRLGALAMAAQNPSNRIKAEDIKKAKEDYAKAVRARMKVILARKEAEVEKKKAKTEKKEAKRVKKLTPLESKREAKQSEQAKADQSVTGELTNEDLQMAEWLDKAGKAELEEGDAEGVQAMLDAGYMQVTKAGTPVLLPAGKARLKAVRAAQEGPQADAPAEEVIEPVPYTSAKKAAERQAVDEEIGRRMRGDPEPEVITPTPFTSQKRRKAQLTARVDKKIKDPVVRERIVEKILKSEEMEQAFNERQAAEARRIEGERDADYDAALNAQADVDVEVAKNLALLDEKGVSGYTGTRIGDVLKNAMNVLESAEAKATAEMKKRFGAMNEQGVLFDVTGVLVKGTAAYSSAVKVGALKIAKHGLKYSAWTADMIGEFGESIRPVLSRVFHDAKKKVHDVLKLSHEKFASGSRKGEMKYAPKQYAKPGAIRRMRNVLNKLVKEGEGGKLWYEKSGKEILKITGGNVRLARKLAGLLAIYSSGTAVSANTTNALKMWAQFYGTGKLKQPKQGTLAGRFGEQDRTAIAWMNSNESDESFVESFGNKRYPFFLNIMRAIDPKNYEAGQGVTVDLWMVRAFGYDQDSPTDAQYAFVATEIKAIGDKLGWEKQQVQAAIWVSIKARWEFIQKQAKEKAVEQGLAELTVSQKGAPVFEVIGNTREEQIENEKKIIVLFREEALKASIKQISKKLEESKADFADNLEKHYATISWESDPSSQLGSGLNNMSLVDKVAMQAEIAEIMTNPETGREYIAEWLELLGADQIVGPGAWEMNIGSAVQNSVIVPVRHKPGKTKTAQKEAASAMDGYAAIMGYLMQQDAVAWHKPFYGQTLKASNGVEILTKGIISHKQTLKLYEAIYELTGNMDHAPIVLDGAVRILNFPEFGGMENNRDFHKAIAEAADLAGIGGNIEVFQSDGSLIGNDWRANKKGQSYVEAINNSENPLVKQAFARAKRKFTGDIAAVHAKYSGEKTDNAPRATRVDSNTKLKRAPKGHIRFRHFGKHDVGVLRVEKHGTGILGAERRRGSLQVISLYPNRGFKKEVGLGNVEYVIDVPKEQLYDVNEDPMNLKPRAQDVTSFKIVKGKKVPTNTRLDMTKLERLIKEAGFVGYYTPTAKGDMKGQARLFKSVVVDHSASKTPVAMDEAITFSIADRPRVTILENDLDEFEVREKDGEIYYTEDADDAIGTARSIYGADATVVIKNTDGEVLTTDVRQTKPKPIKLEGFGGQVEDADAIAALEEFIDEWIEITEPNPISPDERIVNRTAAVTVRPSGGILWADSIRSFSKSEGGGSEALKVLLDLADLHGVTIKILAKPFDTGGNELNFDELLHWYQRNGFVADQTIQDYEPSAYMTRVPQTVKKPFSVLQTKKGKLTNAGYGVPVATIREYLDKHFGKYYGLTNFKVVEGVEELPDDLYENIKTRGVGDRVRGAFYEDVFDGPTIYIVANNAYIDDFSSPNYGEPDLQGMIETVIHETVGHFGLQAMLGKDYDKIMDLIIKGLPKDVAAQLRALPEEYRGTMHGKRTAAEEVVAYMAEEIINGHDLSKNKANIWEKLVAAVKLWMAKMGMRNITHEDVVQLILRSSEFVRRTPQSVIMKRARFVKRMKTAQRIRDAANKGTGEAVTLSIGLKQARKDDPALDRFFAKIGHGHNQRLVALKDWWEIRKGNMRRSFEISMLDQFAGIKHMEQELDILGSESGYMSIRLTAGTDVIIRSAIERGVPIWDVDGSVRTDHSTEGLLQILAPIAQNAEMLKAFEAFIVARRARRLKKENRERLFDREEIGAALKFIRKKKLYKLFNETAKDLAAYKSKVLDFAMEAGLIDPVSRKLWEHNDHVPFYRVLAENTKGPFHASRIGHIGKVIHRLKGGTDPLKNPLEAITQNLSMLIEASVKNRALQDVVTNFNGTGVVTKAPQAEMTTALIPMKQVKDMLFENGVSLDAVGQDLLDGVQKLMALQAPTADNVISVQENGTKQYYYIHDPGVMKGMDGVSPNQWIWLMKFLRLPKRVITRSITLMPDFILKNWFRDIWHAYILGRHGTVLPIYDSAKGWAKAIMQDDTYQDIMAGGGMFDAGYVNASDPKKTKTAIRRGLLGAGRGNILDTPRKLAKFYMRIANGAENAHRIIVYEKALKETGSRKQALFEARDLMDFSVRGANPVVRFLTETVPFWGARVQGISRTAKGFTESPATTFLRAAPIVLASMALYAHNRDDDRYDGLNPYEKRMYYHFYDVFEEGDHYRLPKPFEVGAIFSTMPEIMLELSLSEESDRGKEAAEALAWTIKEMLMLAPDVQALNPIYELMINENRFTEAPIISEWEKQLDPKDRYNHRSNATLRELAQSMPDSAPEWLRSPKQLEHLVRGYLGSAMDYALAASDMVFNKELNGGVMPPEMRWDETPFVKSFKREEYGKYDRYIQSMYEVLEVANKIHNSINKNKKLPQTPDVKARITELREENEALLYARGPTNSAAKSITKINKQIRKVYAHPTMTPAEKSEKLDVLLRKRSEAAQRVYDYRPGGKLNKFDGGEPDASYYDQVSGFLEGLFDKPKDEQVDELISAHLPHTATLINDITISDEKLRELV